MDKIIKKVTESLKKAQRKNKLHGVLFVTLEEEPDGSGAFRVSLVTEKDSEIRVCDVIKAGDVLRDSLKELLYPQAGAPGIEKRH